MKSLLKFAACSLLAGTWVLLWVKPGPARFQRHEASHEERLARGAHLVRAGACGDCHTPKIMTAQGLVDDESRLFAGHPSEVEALPSAPASHPGGQAVAGTTAWAGPWGISYAANLTPDPATGLWSEDSFIKAMRTGKRRGHGRPILPPMPWEVLSGATDEDLKSIYAYLASLPPVFNSVPEPVAPPASAAAADREEMGGTF